MLTDSLRYEAYCNLLPSAGLCRVLCDCLPVFYPKHLSVFRSNFLPYKKVDIATTALPCFLIYFTQSTSTGDVWYKKGTLFMDQVYPSGAMVRERSTEIAGVVCDIITDIILKDQNFFVKLKYGEPDEKGFPSGGLFPALVELGSKISVEYAENNALIKEQSTITIRQRVSYTIDIQQWWTYIQEVKGNNIHDPCVNIYPIFEDYLLTIKNEAFNG